MQLKVGTRDGATLTFELPGELDAWKAREDDPTFQRSVTSLGLIRDGVYHAVPAPSAFRQVWYRVEARLNGGGNPAAFRAGYTADDVTVWATIYLKGSPPMVRFDVRRTGRLRWHP